MIFEVIIIFNKSMSIWVNRRCVQITSASLKVYDGESFMLKRLDHTTKCSSDDTISTTLYGTLEYKPLLLNSVWGFHNGKGPACISDVICIEEAGQKAESWQWKIPGSFLLPATPLQPLWLTPKPWQELNTDCFSLSDIPGSRRTRPCGIGTQAAFPFPLHNTFL